MVIKIDGVIEGEDKVEECEKCGKWIGFLDDIVCVETGKMGLDHWSLAGFVTGKGEKIYYHKGCWK